MSVILWTPTLLITWSGVQISPGEPKNLPEIVRVLSGYRDVVNLI